MNVLKILASRIVAYKNCIKSNNHGWEQNHLDVINKIVSIFPHGSGINDYHLDIDSCNDSKIVFSSSFNTMTENGYYDTVINFTVIVKPNFVHDFTISIKGNFGKYQDVKEYLINIYSIFFDSEIPNFL